MSDKDSDVNSKMKVAKPEFDPGAMQFGNFINYYQFHSPEDRIRLLTADIWDLMTLDEHFACLDIGCNCGDLTESLHEILMSQKRGPLSPNTHQEPPNNKVKILGVDIDGTLIDRANEKNTLNDISYKCLDIMEQDAMQCLKSYFTAKNTDLLGITDSNDIDENVELKSSVELTEKLKISNQVEEQSNMKTECVNQSLDEGKSVSNNAQKTISTVTSNKFSIVFCFSVTMWIHLNHGDEGLCEFLRKVSTLGKYLVLENQPWKCYRNAQRRMVKNSYKAKKRETCHGVNEKCPIESMDEEIVDSIVRNKGIKTSNVHKEGRAEASNIRREKGHRTEGTKAKKQKSEIGFKYYHQLKMRSDVDKQIDAFLREKCRARKLYESEKNDWDRVITVYEVL